MIFVDRNPRSSESGRLPKEHYHACADLLTLLGIHAHLDSREATAITTTHA
jgi:hypothetical protein